MSFTDSIKDTYYSLEDKWYALVDKISEKVPAFGSAVDWVEDKNIPSFPAAIVLLILVILLIFFLLTINNTLPMTITVLDNEGLAISGATVTVFLNNSPITQTETNTEGKALFKLANGKYSVRAEKTGFTIDNKDVEAGKNEIMRLTSTQTNIRTIYMKTSDGKLITGSGTVKYYCDGSNVEKSAFYKDGTFQVEFNEGCQEITIESVSGYKVVLGKASFSGSTNVTVEEENTITGNVRVNLTSSVTIPAGIRVILTAEDGVPQQVKVTETSVVVFSNVPTKKYYVTVYDPRMDVSPKFADFDGKKLGEVKELKQGETIEFTINLETVSSKKIAITVTDVDTGIAIKGAEVGLNLVSNASRLETKTTGVTGQVVFDVKENEIYNISADHPDYIIGTTKSVTSANTDVSISLVRANPENSQSIKVNVVDTEGKIIDNAKVTLKKLDNTIIDEKTTGSSGSAEFYNLEINQSYYVYVAKDDYSANSTSITVAPRRQTVIEVKLNIGKGKIKLFVLDSEKSILKNASVKMYNYYTQNIEEQKNVNSSGVAEFEVRADKLVYFVIESSEYLNYTTATIRPDADSTIEKEIAMYRSSGKLEVLLSMNQGSSTVKEENSTSTVSAGTYNVTAVLLVPKGNYSEAGIHLRTGKAIVGTSNLMEEDTIRIIDTKSSASRTIKGTTYTPNNGYDKDSKNLTSGDAKWVNVIFRNAKEGVYELNSTILISEVNQLQGLSLWYRGWAKGGTTIRYPASNLTGANELYSTANNYILMSGATGLCSNGYCRSNTIEVLTGNDTGKKYYINNTFNGKKDVTYLLKTELTNSSGKSVSGATLNLESVGADVNLIVVDGKEYDTKTIDLGTLQIDAYKEILIIFTPKIVGNNTIKMKIDSSTKTEFEQTITVPIKANKKFTLDVIPKEIIPYIENDMFFEVVDGNTPLSGVLIEVKKGVNVLGTVETSGEGLATYKLASPSIGEEITINATKEGYDTITVTKKVNKSILLITPPEISETIKIGETASISQTVLMQNSTVKDIKIKSANFDSELKTYLDIKFTTNLVDTLIEKDKDKNFTLTIKPNTLARKLTEPKDISGELVINTEIEGTTQVYENIIPIDIRLSMPGYIDNAKCLKVSPASLEFITASGNESTKTIEIENTCTAEGISVNLQNIEAKISEDSTLGSILVSGEGFSGGLSTNYTKIGTTLTNSEKVTLTVRFVPSGAVSSGTQEIKITFRGANVPEEEEKEYVEASVSLNLTMNNLSKCIEIVEPDDGITLEVAGWNMGYSRLINSNISAYAQNYEGFTRRSNSGSYPYGFNSAIPFMGSGNTSSNYEQGSFSIKNNCASDVLIDLDADSKISVSEDEFTIGAGSEQTVTVSPGYTLGRYKIKVNAKLDNTSETKKKIGEVSVLVRRLGDIDDDCIKLSTKIISLNSFIYSPKKYKVFNYCYDSGVTLERSNSAVSIECDSPNAVVNQLGQMNQAQINTTQNYNNNMYGNNNLNSMYASNYNYTQGQSCASNNCSVITGIRTVNRSVSESSALTTETIEFEVLPNASYIPQTKLFNASSGQYGLFQSLGDFRNWMTQTDARTNITGNVNVQYSNQYGQKQCMTFPVDIEDDWRMLESIDSAINWGDPNASPEECVSKEQTRDSLDIYAYWLERGNNKGAIPDTEYTNKGNYIYYPKVPAVQIGPAPYESLPLAYYPNMQYLNNYQGQNYSPVKKEQTGNAKNCGLLDRLSNITYQKVFEGAILTVEGTTKGGSILNNTKGPNLMVEINRNGLTQNCVVIKTSVIAKLTRAVNFQSGEVRWNLRALVAKPGYVIKSPAGNLDEVEKECKVIDDTNNPIIIDTNQGQQTAPGCATKPDSFGFSKIKEVSAEMMTNTDKYCTEYFCNQNMLEVFLRNKLKGIKEQITQQNFTEQCNAKGTIMLSKLYEAANTTKLNTCSTTKTENTYYNKEDGNLIEEAYKIPEEYTKDVNLVDIKLGASAKDISLSEVAKVLGQITDNEVYAKIDANNIIENDINLLGAKKVGKYYYISTSYLKELNDVIWQFELEKCSGTNTKCTITLCKTNVEVKATTVKEMYENLVGLVKLVSTNAPTEKEIEQIYTTNPKLNTAHKLAVFSTEKAKTNTGLMGDLYLTQINKDSKGITEGMFASVPTGFGDNNYKIEYKNTISVGKYELEMDMNICRIETMPVDVNLILKEVDLNMADAKKNIILTSGFNVLVETKTLADTTIGVLVKKYDNEVKLLSRIPIKLIVNVSPEETALNYYPSDSTIRATAQNSLISWIEQGNKRNDTKTTANNFVYQFNKSQEQKGIMGIYYYPEAGSITFTAGNGNGKYTAKVISVGTNTTKTENGDLPQAKTGAPVTIQAEYKALTLKEVLDLIKVENGKACISTDGQTINWNETKLLSE